MPTKDVFQMRYWSRDEERPWIDFEIPQNGIDVPWLHYGKVLSGQVPSHEYSPVHFVSDDPTVSLWHSYNIAGTHGMLSKTAIDLIGPYMTRCFEFLEAWVNELPFFLLRRIGSVDCLDRSNSKVVTYPHDPDRVMKIKQFRFFREGIADPMVFVIPENKGGLLATGSIKQIVEEAGLKGLYFSETE